jgi:methionyl-tRNA formyltransferase
MLRVGFAGTPEFAVPTLEALIRSPEIQLECVYTQPDRPSGRGRKLSASAVKQCAISANVPIRQPQTLKSDEDIAAFQALKLDALIVVAYGQILKPDILNSPRLGCLNVHASLLPRWRGAAPLQRAIEAGDAHTGISIMQMDVGLDTGAPLLLSTLLQLDAGQLQSHPQPSDGVTYAGKITTEDAMIRWDSPTTRVMRHIHAFNPVPGAYCFSNDMRLKIFRVSHTELPVRAAGDLWQTADGRLMVSTRDGVVEVLECQLPGAKRLDAMGIRQLKHASWATPHRLKTEPS